MFARLGHLLLALALLGATGTHWAVLQSVAWTTMIVENARHEPLGAAVARTLSGEKPCDLCKRIAAGKQSENRAEFPALKVKLEFVHSPAPLALFAPLLDDEAKPFRHTGAHRTEAPPVPPPRFVAA